MVIGKIIKRAVQVCAALGLLAMFGFPLAGAWLDAHPDTQAALGGAVDNVDPEAGAFTRAKQFVTGLSKSRDAVKEKKREEIEDKAAAELDRKETERRRFNSGEMAQQDY